MVKLRIVFLLGALPFVTAASRIIAQGGTMVITNPGTAATLQDGTRSFATVSYGALDLFAGANCGGSSTCSTSGRAQFSDSITIFGTSGTLVADFTIVHLGHDEGFDEGRFDLGDYTGIFSGTFCRGCESLVHSTFTSGVPIGIFASGDVSATDFLPQDPQNGAGDARVTIAFSDFRVLDSANQPISGFRYTSESGTDYGIAGGTPTPEPADVTFVGAGLLVFLASRLRGALQIQRRSGNPNCVFRGNPKPTSMTPDPTIRC
jgi:hypothetical protein